MDSDLIEIFWAEKVKLTQFTMEYLSLLSEEFLNKKNQKKSIFQSLDSLVRQDDNFRILLSAYRSLSSIIPFSSQTSSEMEKDLIKVRDQISAPALPVELNKIVIHSVHDLQITTENDSLLKKFIEWKKNLIRVESLILHISKKDDKRFRYFSKLGILSFPVAINYNVILHLKLFSNEIYNFSKNQK